MNSFLRILFIGNSHTYYNDLPQLFREQAQRTGIDCQVLMLAHGGWFLDQHLREPDTLFNIRFGGFDYVVLQEHSHPFDPYRFLASAKSFCGLIKTAGAEPVLYMTWAMRDRPQDQDGITHAFRQAAEETGALLAPVGSRRNIFDKQFPGTSFYADDGAHPSPEGSRFAASVLLDTVLRDLAGRTRTEPQ